MTAQTERESFELWALSAGYSVGKRRGDYWFPATMRAWDAWQARGVADQQADVVVARRPSQSWAFWW